MNVDIGLVVRTDLGSYKVVPPLQICNVKISNWKSHSSKQWGQSCLEGSSAWVCGMCPVTHQESTDMYMNYAVTLVIKS